MIYSYLNYRFGEKIQIPFVENYTIEFSWPHRVDVIVYEKNVVGYTEYMGRYMYFDKDGIIVESSSEKTEGIPLVTGLQFGHIILYEPLPVEDQDVFEEILNLTQLFEKYNLSVDKIYFDSNYHAVLYMGDLKVRLGDSSLLDGKIAELADMLPVLADKGKGTLYLDQYSETAINSNYYFKKEE